MSKKVFKYYVTNTIDTLPEVRRVVVWFPMDHSIDEESLMVWVNVKAKSDIMGEDDKPLFKAGDNIPFGIFTATYGMTSPDRKDYHIYDDYDRVFLRIDLYKTLNTLDNAQPNFLKMRNSELNNLTNLIEVSYEDLMNPREDIEEYKKRLLSIDNGCFVTMKLLPPGVGEEIRRRVVEVSESFIKLDDNSLFWKDSGLCAGSNNKESWNYKIDTIPDECVSDGDAELNSIVTEHTSIIDTMSPLDAFKYGYRLAKDKYNKIE